MDFLQGGANGPVRSADFVTDRKAPGLAAKGWWGWKDEKRWLEALFAFGARKTVAKAIQ